MKSSMEAANKASLEERHPVVEEVEDVVCTRSVLVRFPCFDFFRNVHLCEGKVSKGNDDNIYCKDNKSDIKHINNSNKGSATQGNDSKTTDNDKAKYDGHSDDAIREENIQNASSTPLEFRPDSVEFVPGTLYNEHPILVINAGTPNEMVFIGNWSEVINEGSNTVTNRAIVQLVEEEDSICTNDIVTSYSNDNDGDNNNEEYANASTNNLVESKMKDIKNTKKASDSVNTDVASLFTHHPGGVTADEERATKRRRLTEQKCCIGSVDVPSAILVMHRYK